MRRIGLSCCNKIDCVIQTNSTKKKNDSDFYWLNCLHSIRAKHILKPHENVSENKDFCGAIMASEDIKFYKISSIIYGDLECLIKRISGSKNNF